MRNTCREDLTFRNRLAFNHFSFGQEAWFKHYFLLIKNNKDMTF